MIRASVIIPVPRDTEIRRVSFELLRLMQLITGLIVYVTDGCHSPDKIALLEGCI